MAAEKKVAENMLWGGRFTREYFLSIDSLSYSLGFNRTVKSWILTV